MEKESELKKKRAADLLYAGSFIISVFFIYDLLMNGQSMVLQRASKSAVIYAAQTQRTLEDVLCEYKSDMEGRTTCNLVFRTRGDYVVETVDCVTGFYHFVIKSDQTCYTRGSSYGQ